MKKPEKKKKQVTPNIRRKYISDVIARYKKKYPEHYKLFIKQIKKRRAMISDEEFGIVNSESKDKTSDPVRAGVSLPEEVYAMLDYALNGIDEKKFGHEKGEMKWFYKEFPEFCLTSKNPYEDKS